MEERKDNLWFMKYVVYILLALITIGTGYQFSVMASLPDKYVRIQEYTYDRDHTDKALDKIQESIDRVQEKMDCLKDTIHELHKE